MAEISYKSKLAPFIEGYVAEKRSCGYLCVQQAKDLRNFDRFVIEQGLDTGRLDKKTVDNWSLQRTTEGESARLDRICRVRQLAKYMASLDVPAYIPPSMGTVPETIPYVLSKEEVSTLFRVADEGDVFLMYHTPYRFRGYAMMFRLYYHCGLRLNEAVVLERKDVDLSAGILLIRHSKGDKDRKVPMDDSIVELMRGFDDFAETVEKGRRWFFPGRDAGKTYHKASVCQAFSSLWTTSYGATGRHPTPHSLRHTFVVHRIDAWTEEGKDVNALMPYLQKYLGHSSVNETMYYYHCLDPMSKATRLCFERSNVLAKEVLDGDIL